MIVRRRRLAPALVVLALAAALPAAPAARDALPPQPPTTPTTPPSATLDASSLEALRVEIRRLQEAIAALQTELAASRRETATVQQALQALRSELDEEQRLLESSLSGLNQVKVESGSKYRVKVFGMALMQLVSARGSVDNIDVPILAMESIPGDSGGNVSAAVRQSFIGLAVFGPKLAGLDTSGDLRLDFFGGFPAVNDGLSAPGLRLRTMSLAADGRNVSIRAGQEAPFFSPLSPSSLASTAYPAMSSSGNIWAWTPQVYVERRFARSTASTVTVRAGVMDALTGELPAGEYSRLPTAGERSRLPASAVRVGWRRRHEPDEGAVERVTSGGAGVYYSRHNWGFDRVVNAWAVTGDFEVPVGRRLALSGELYRGEAMGGLGGGAHSSVLFDGSPQNPSSVVHPLRSIGGWAQAKVIVTPRLDVNVALGGDRSKPRPFDGLLEPPNNEVPSASRNASGFMNVMYQVRSNLIFTVEYKRLWTRRFDGRAWLADHVSLGGAIVF